jgi:hypothetical protein
MWILNLIYITKQKFSRIEIFTANIAHTLNIQGIIEAHTRTITRNKKKKEI